MWDNTRDYFIIPTLLVIHIPNVGTLLQVLRLKDNLDSLVEIEMCYFFCNNPGDQEYPILEGMKVLI